MNRALIFDCDGVLGDTEPHGHRVAFNQMWRELGVPWEWSLEPYGEMLRIGGGKERMEALLREPSFLAVFAPPAEATARREMLADWHRRKTAIYQDLVHAGRVPPRSGVQRLSEEALNRGWKLAVASTSAEPSVQAMLRRAVGGATARRFSAVLGGDIVSHKKPAPDIYLLAARLLDVPPARCVVIEDSSIGLRAALAAGMQCVITVSAYTRGEDFTGASLVLTCLGDPDGERCQVLADRSNARPGPWLGCDDLESLLTTFPSGTSTSVPPAR